MNRKCKNYTMYKYTIKMYAFKNGIVCIRGSCKFAYLFCNVFTVPCAKILLQHPLGLK